MSIPQSPAEAQIVEEVAGVILHTPKARKVASAVVGVAGVVLTGVAQTVNILAGNHVMPPDPLWLQITWQWFGLAAAFAGFTWNANVK